MGVKLGECGNQTFQSNFEELSYQGNHEQHW